MKQFVPFILLGTAWMLGTLSAGHKSEVNPDIVPAGLEAQDQSAAASLIGNFRTSASAFLYLKADSYLHNGVEMRPLSGSEIAQGRSGVGGDAQESGLGDDSKRVTVVPDATHDYRGIFGDIERQTSTYKGMVGHTHSNPTQSLPLYRLMTWLDPQFIPGWTTGAYVILYNKSAASLERALEHLHAGLEKNPSSIEIFYEISSCYLKIVAEAGQNHRDYESALPYLESACKIGTQNFSRLSMSEKEATLNAHRRFVVCLRDTGRYALASKAADIALHQFPKDGPILRLKDQVAILSEGKSIFLEQPNTMVKNRLIKLEVPAINNRPILSIAESLARRKNLARTEFPDDLPHGEDDHDHDSHNHPHEHEGHSH
jgi:tetratricopeptide (TPR) repeat protein